MDDRIGLRQKILGQRDQLDPQILKEKSEVITKRVLAHPLVQQARTLFIYVDFRSEAATASLIRSCLGMSKGVIVPLTLRKEKRLAPIRITDPESQLQPGYCGIPEPKEDIVRTQEVDPSTIDLVIAPGSVFDPRGGRLGYGGGYYDRFFVDSAPGAVRMAIAFDLQIVERVPMQSHDQYMDYIITEKIDYDCRRKRNA